MGNIIVIMCDQLRKDYISAYGCQGIETSNIDSLAQSGVLFTNAVTASPVCGPARACVMTGKSVSEHGVFTNDIEFKEGLEYLPQTMTSLGYKTAAFGKLHHTPADDMKGFEYGVQMEEGRLKEREPYLKWKRDRKGIFDYNGRIDDYYEHFITDKAIDYIRQNADENMFLWISFQSPHDPFDAPKCLRGQVDYKNLPETKRNGFMSETAKYRSALTQKRGWHLNSKREKIKYAAEILEIDYEIGRILKELKKQNIFEKTHIIFSADHGELLGDYNMHGKGPYPFSSQFEVPMIVSSPQFSEKTINDNIVSNADIAATVLSFAGMNFGLGSSVDMLSEKRVPVRYSEFCDIAKFVSTDEYRFCFYPFSREMILFKRNDETVNYAYDEKYKHLVLSFLNEIIVNLSRVVQPDKYNADNIDSMIRTIEKMIIKKGVRMEAQDINPKVQKGLDEYLSDWRKTIPIAYPIINRYQLRMLRKHHLNWKYNEFCIGRERVADYGVYWE